MTYAIRSFSNKNNNEIIGRREPLKVHVRTINLNQTDGNFVSALPLENSIVVYGQSPNSSNSWFGQSQTVTDLGIYGEFSFPLDAKFDYVRRKIWVADTGNNRMIELDYNSNSVDFEITNILYPSALTINQSNGDIFVRGFSSSSDGVIYWMNKSG